ncbi:MAG: hypothetical protein ACRDAM_01845 [Casimicrobium sp.]
MLDRTDWDLTLDALGNIALASPPYSVVQDVSSAARLVRGELWYGGPDGVDHFDEALGKSQPTQVFRAQIVRAARRVPGVLSARAFLRRDASRILGGQIQIETTDGSFRSDFA